MRPLRPADQIPVAGAAMTKAATAASPVANASLAMTMAAIANAATTKAATPMSLVASVNLAMIMAGAANANPVTIMAADAKQE